jgi:hypothetical protein
MISLALVATLFGATLGACFTVFAVIPAIACASLVAWAGWFAGGGTLSALVTDLLLLVAALQVGYLCGAALRFSLGFTKAAIGPGTPSSTPGKSISHI